jgi:hypothetical protein
MATSYKVKPGNIFGRVGEGFGQGLAQQGQKELDRYQLRQGLEDVANNSEGLTPFQRFTKLSSVPGITPQQVESGTRLLERESQRNAFRNPRSGEQMPGQAGSASPTPSVQEVAFSPTKAGVGMRKEDQPKSAPIEGHPLRSEEAAQPKRIVNENPITNKFLPGIPWNQNQWDREADREWARDPTADFETISQRVNERQARLLAAPEAEQKRYEYLQDKEVRAEKELDHQIEVALQKEGKEVYGDLSGDTLLDLKERMNDDLATNPSMGIKEAATKWRKNAKDFVEKKNIIRTDANRDFYDRIAPGKKVEQLKTLQSGARAYEKMGKSREFYNMLTTKNKPPAFEVDPQTGQKVMTSKGEYGYDLSPGGAALITYPRSEGLKNIIKTANLDHQSIDDMYGNSQKMAKEFIEKKGTNDSALAFGRSLMDTYNFFDISAYFDYLRDNEDKLSPDQQKEVLTGVPDATRNWGDFALFPLFGRSVVND